MDCFEEFERWWEKTGKQYGYDQQAVYCGFRWGWIIGQSEEAAEQSAAPDALPLCDCGMGDGTMPEFHADDCAVNQRR